MHTAEIRLLVLKLLLNVWSNDYNLTHLVDMFMMLNQICLKVFLQHTL